MKTRVLVLAFLAALTPAAAVAAPAPLSADRAPADVASTYGSGSFGRWLVDSFGMPAFRYDVDEQTATSGAPARAPRSHRGTA